MNNTNSIVIENMIFLSYNLCNLQFIQKSRGLTIMSLHFTYFYIWDVTYTSCNLTKTLKIIQHLVFCYFLREQVN